MNTHGNYSESNRGEQANRTSTFQVTPIENELCFAQVYSVAEDYCKVLIWKYQTLANVDLKSVRRIVPHHFCLTAKENCVVAVPWPELSKASAEKRLPIVHLLALHDSKAEAEAAVNLDASAGSEIAAAPVPIGLPVPSPHQEHGETSSDSDLARTPSPQPIEFRDFETGSPRCPRDFHLSRVEGFCGIAPKRDQLQMAYWSGVRDGALRYQQLMSPCYASMNPPLNELPMKYNTVNRLFHNT